MLTRFESGGELYPPPPSSKLNQINILEQKVRGPFDKVVIKDCGHNPFIEYTDKTIEHINAFIKKII